MNIKSRIRRIATAMLLTGVLVGAGMVAAAPAQAAGNNFYNYSASLSIDVETNSGLQYRIPAQARWENVKYVVVRQGQCVSIESRGQFCPARGSIWVYIGDRYGTYAVRTR